MNSFYVTWLLSQSIKNLQMKFFKTCIIQIMISLCHPIERQDSELPDYLCQSNIEGFITMTINMPCLPIQTKKIQKVGKRYRKSCWTLSQNLKYKEFLLSNGHLLEASLENRRETQVNKMLSVYLKTRSPDQCRSHHQKMIVRHRSIEGIVEYIDQLTQIRSSESNQNKSRGNCLSKKLRIRKQKPRKGQVDQWIDCIWYSTPVDSIEPQTE